MSVASEATGIDSASDAVARAVEDATQMRDGFLKQKKNNESGFTMLPVLVATVYQGAQDYYSQQYPEDHATWTEVSTLKPLCLSVTYLLTIYFGRKIMASRSPPARLKEYIVTYNLYQVCLNAWCVYMLIKEISFTCYRLGVNPWHLRVEDTSHFIGYLVWVHYNNKFVEFLDTIFMVLNKKDEQISFLHVYHHVLLVWSWWAVCRFGGAGGVAWFSACFNSFVHVLMYAYYMLAAMKVPCPWKKKLTQIQMTQFVMCMSSAFYGMYYNLYPLGLSLLNVWVMLNMVVLFYRFYQRRYKNAKAKGAAPTQPTTTPIKQE